MALTQAEKDELELLELEEEQARYQQQEKSPAAETSTLEALARGAGQGATFGLSDEITAGVRSIPDYLRGKGKLGDIYDTKLKDERAELAAAQSKHPWAYGGGAIAGGLALPIPGAGAKAAGSAIKTGLTLGKIGKGALTGAGMGAAFGFGSGEGGVEERLKGAGEGAKSGAVLGAALPVAGAGIVKTGKVFSNAAKRGYEGIFDSLGFKEKALKRMLDTTKDSGYKIKKLDKVRWGKIASDNKINLFKNPENKYVQAQKMKQQLGGNLRGELRRADALVGGRGIDADEVLAAVEKGREEALGSGITDSNAINSWFDKQIKIIIDKYGLTNERPIGSQPRKLPFTEVNNLKTTIDGQISNWSALPGSKAGRLHELRNSFKNLIEENLKKVRTPDGKTAYSKVKPASDAYHEGMFIHDAVEDAYLASQRPPRMQTPEVSIASMTGSWSRAANALPFLGRLRAIQWLGRKADYASAAGNQKLQSIYTGVKSKWNSLPEGTKKSFEAAAKRGDNSVVAWYFVQQQTNPKFQDKD